MAAVRPPISTIRPQNHPGANCCVKVTGKEVIGLKQKTKPRYNAAQNSLYMIRRAWHTIPSILVIAVGIILSWVAINLLELFVVPTILAAIEHAGSPASVIRLIVAFTAAMILAYSAQAYLSLNALFGRVHLRIQISTELHDKFCTTSYSNLLDTAYIERSEKAQKSTRGNQEATEAIWKTLTVLSIHVISFAIYLLLLASIDPLILVVTVLAAAASYWIGRTIRQWRYRHRDEEAAYQHKLSYINQRARNRELAKDVRIFGLGDWLRELWEQYLTLYQDFCAKSEKMNLLADAADIFATLLRNGVAYFYLIHITTAGRLSASEFVLYFAAVSGFGKWTTGILNNLEILNRQSMDISVTREYLEEPEPFRFADGKPLEVQPGHRYSLELRDVSFHYPNASENVLSHVNLKIQPGEKLAIVGLNGAGKTTIIRLLCGFLDPTGGQVLLDGEDIRQYNRRDYYRLISAVFQQFSILAGSIAENVAQSMGEVDQQRVQQCLNQAGLSEKINALPKGVDTLLNRKVFEDAVELSGGETQRLLLARALYKAGPIIVLDEPTAALDAITESNIYQKYHEMTAGCTAIYISHRLASTRFCDRIILVENGTITEEGTHDELIALGGSYAHLFAVQSKYYREEAAQHEEA